MKTDASQSAKSETAESESPAKRRILLVEDHPITRLGLKAVIDQQPDLRVCDEADDAGKALQIVSRNPPDLVIADISLKSANGIELTKNLVAQVPGIPILIVSMHDETIYAERALRAGARGYLMKQVAAEKIVDAARCVLRGDIYLSEKSKETMLHHMVKKRSDEHVFPIDTLSDREMEVFQLIGDGYSTRQIAEKLHLSSKTIDSYREHLKLKLNLSSGADLVRHAIEWGRTGRLG
ncbi:MAG TPA: response regulator transcription factor [Opitutaceae bacterium]|nr:response regulator transcription factor [Opitutaceae bacterium]